MPSDFSESEERTETFVVDASEESLRLDVAVALHFEDVSRAQAKRWIEEGRVRLDGRKARPARTCRAGDRIDVVVPALAPATPEPEPIPLDVLFEDRSVVVVAKRAGMVVHPSPGHPTGTLVNALLAHTRDLSGIGGVARPGIVHRLDAGTSGVLVVAKSDRAHRHLAAQFQGRTVDKQYLAVVHGEPPERFVVDRPIGRDLHDRTRISSRSATPRDATSEFEVLERFPLSASLDIRIRTGRTHQIRVHLSEAGYPVVGDRDYGAPRRPRGPARRSASEAAAFRLLRDFPRTALHASRLAFDHPETGARLRFVAPVPADLEELLEKLRGLRSCAS
jgi:23S rRNA pseudouridine1911/1915/1917 synthase